MKIKMYERDTDMILSGDETSIDPRVYEFLCRIMKAKYPKMDKNISYRIEIVLDGEET